MNIVDFITARLDDDEKTARAARPGPWIDEGGYSGPKIGVDYLMVPTDGSAPCNDAIPSADSRHIAHNDPARVLQEVRAKRAIISDLDGYCWVSPGNPCGMCGRIGCRNLALLANVYVDHPDFDQEWRV